MIGARLTAAARRARGVLVFTMVAAACLCAGGCRTVEQRSFDSPEAAVDALVAALRPEVDRAALEKLFGPDIEDALPSGDEVADRTALDTFLDRYDRGHRFVDGPEGSKILEIDTDHWPFAFPIRRSDGKWMFDTIAGLEELDNRRVGANELDTIQTCLAIVDAQREYALLDADRDGVHEYAQKFLSDAGTRNGLFWPVGAGEAPSPLGELIGRAAEEGYTRGAGVYHGYRFKILTSQGEGAAGGRLEYMARGKLIGGFGVLAWPAEYGRSGIKSFITNHDGVVFESDLGDNTEDAARAMKVFDPAGWSLVAD